MESLLGLFGLDDCLINSPSSAEKAMEREFDYDKIENIKKMKQFAIVMKKHGDSLDYTADYLKFRTPVQKKIFLHVLMKTQKKSLRMQH